jgi:hypothetical protein
MDKSLPHVPFTRRPLLLPLLRPAACMHATPIRTEPAKHVQQRLSRPIPLRKPVLPLR